jgi:serine phosphatase RsbU (regulator of sigma subunit)
MNHIDQRKVIVAMNEEFTRLGEEGRFATAVMMTYFSPLNELSVCNAGHPPPLIYTKATKAWRYLETRAVAGHDDIENIPLGILADAGYEQFGVELAQGDLVLCYTDSLVEAVCRDKTLLGTQRLLDMVGTVNAAEPAHVIHHLLAKLTVYGAALNDDVTVLVAHCTGPAKGAGLFARLGAQLKFLGQVATFRRNIPWPELSMRNVGGLVSQRLSKRAK